MVYNISKFLQQVVERSREAVKLLVSQESPQHALLAEGWKAQVLSRCTQHPPNTIWLYRAIIDQYHGNKWTNLRSQPCDRERFRNSSAAFCWPPFIKLAFCVFGTNP